jgi:hypothetical protein
MKSACRQRDAFTTARRVPERVRWILRRMVGLARYRVTFAGRVIHWRGPSPFHFVAVPDQEAEEIHDIAPLVTYGWGVIPAQVRIGGTVFSTALFPRNGGYLVPIKDLVRRAEQLAVGDTVTVELTIGR